MRIDVSDGSIVFARGTIRGPTQRTEILRSAIGNGAREQIANEREDWRHVALDPEPGVAATLIFQGEKLHQVFVALRTTFGRHGTVDDRDRTRTENEARHLASDLARSAAVRIFLGQCQFRDRPQGPRECDNRQLCHLTRSAPSPTTATSSRSTASRCAWNTWCATLSGRTAAPSCCSTRTPSSTGQPLGSRGAGAASRCRTFVPIHRPGEMLWQAEQPEADDHYYRIESREPLVALSFSAYRCDLDLSNGRILAKNRLK